MIAPLILLTLSSLALQKTSTWCPMSDSEGFGPLARSEVMAVMPDGLRLASGLSLDGIQEYSEGDLWDFLDAYDEGQIPMDQRRQSLIGALTYAHRRGFHSVAEAAGERWAALSAGPEGLEDGTAAYVWAVIQLDAGRAHECLRFLARALRSRKFFKSDEVAMLLRLTAQTNLQLEKIEDAKKASDEALSMLRGATDAEMIAGILLTGISVAEYAFDDAQMTELTKKLEDLMKTSGSLRQSEHLQGYTGLATSYINKGRLYDAEVLLEEGLAKPNLCVNCRRVATYTKAWNYIEMGRAKEALPLFEKLVAEYKEEKDYLNYQTNLIKMAWCYEDLGESDKEIQIYEEAIDFFSDNAMTVRRDALTANLVRIYLVREEVEKAKHLFSRVEAPLMRSESPVMRRDVMILSARVQRATGHPEEALQILDRVLVEIPSSLPTRNVWPIYWQARIYQDQGKIGIAILKAKEAVNLAQRVRSDNMKLDQVGQEALSGIYSSVFRLLAELLVTDGRIIEAEHVLQLLEIAQQIEFVRSAKSLAEFSLAVAYVGKEQEWVKHWAELEGQQAAILVEKEKLSATRGRTAEQEKRLADLTAQSEVLRAGVAAYLEVIESEIKEERADREKQAQERVSEAGETTGVQKYLTMLANGNTDRAAAYVIVGEHLTHLIVCTTAGRQVKSIELGRTELSKSVAELRVALNDTSLNPRTEGKKIYDWIVKPVEEMAGHKPIIWCLDGPLLQVPFAALWDGEQFLVQRTTDSRYSPLSVEMLTMPGRGEAMSGFASAEQANGFSALPGTAAEIEFVKESITGASHVNEDFTEIQLRDSILQKEGDVLHIATHFRIGKDMPSSTLLIGRRTTERFKNDEHSRELSLQELNSWGTNLFGHLDLLVLSACQTGEEGMEGLVDGRYVGSFTSFAMESGANSVLSSLWEVADESTASLMGAFYRRWVKEGMTKDEALRLSQLDMIEGRLKPGNFADWVSSRGPERVSEKPTIVPDPDKPWSHPKYWAPFVLTGNFK